MISLESLTCPLCTHQMWLGDAVDVNDEKTENCPVLVCLDCYETIRQYKKKTQKKGLKV